MKNAKISFTTDPKLLDDCRHLANELGMSLSTLLNMCLVQFRAEKKIPFTTVVPKQNHTRNDK